MSNVSVETIIPLAEALPASIDLDAYFKRVGYHGQHQSTLETLQAIHYRHALTIPFENLNPLLQMPVQLDVGSLQQKLVLGGRGGYCFEQNLLLSHVLRAIGFRIRGLAARILWNQPKGEITMRTHMLLLVEVQEEYFIADVGFGGMTLTSPLRLEINLEQSTSHEPFRFLKDNEEFIMQAKIRDEWKPIYRFSLQENYLPDYEVFNYYLSTHPSSHFVIGLIVAKPTPDARYTLKNNELAVHHLKGSTERFVLTSTAELRAVLEETFCIILPENPKLEATLQALTQNRK